MAHAPDSALLLAQPSSQAAGGMAADSPVVTGVEVRAKSLTLLAADGSAVRAPSAVIAEGQTFGALGGSRHVELQANPCVFGSECSAVFYDEVHDSIITIQPSASKKPGVPCALPHDLPLPACSLSPQATRYLQSPYQAKKHCENFLMQNPRCQFL